MKKVLALLCSAALVLAFIVASYAAAGDQIALTGDMASASGTQNDGSPASAAIDGDTGSAWRSQMEAGDAWLLLDLGTSKTIDSVYIDWEFNYATAFKIQISDNGTDFTDVYTGAGTGSGAGNASDIILTPATGKYVRVLVTERSNGTWGVGINELKLYEGASDPNPNPGTGVESVLVWAVLALAAAGTVALTSKKAMA